MQRSFLKTLIPYSVFVHSSFYFHYIQNVRICNLMHKLYVHMLHTSVRECAIEYLIRILVIIDFGRFRSLKILRTQLYLYP